MRPFSSGACGVAPMNGIIGFCHDSWQLFSHHCCTNAIAMIVNCLQVAVIMGSVIERAATSAPCPRQWYCIVLTYRAQFPWPLHNNQSINQSISLCIYLLLQLSAPVPIQLNPGFVIKSKRVGGLKVSFVLDILCAGCGVITPGLTGLISSVYFYWQTYLCMRCFFISDRCLLMSVTMRAFLWQTRREAIRGTSLVVYIHYYNELKLIYFFISLYCL